MNKLITCLVMTWLVTACGTEQPDPMEQTSTQAEKSPLFPGQCAPQSLGVCSNATIGAFCTPRLRCLPAQELPDGGIFCLCQSQSTI